MNQSKIVERIRSALAARFDMVNGQRQPGRLPGRVRQGLTAQGAERAAELIQDGAELAGFLRR